MAYFILHLYHGQILGPVFSLEEAEGQLLLVDKPNEWIIVKEVKKEN